MSRVGFRRLDRGAVLTRLQHWAAEVAARHPGVVRVILFGSLATARASGSSDADVVIVVREDARPFLQRTVEPWPDVGVPVDLFIYTVAETTDPPPLLRRALAEGLDLLTS